MEARSAGYRVVRNAPTTALRQSNSEPATSNRSASTSMPDPTVSLPQPFTDLTIGWAVEKKTSVIPSTDSQYDSGYPDYWLKSIL